jgi:transposase InsO family protein
MIIRMENAEGLSLPQMEALLETSQEVRFAAKGRKEIYEWVERVLVRQEYAMQGKRTRGVVRAYLAKMTGKSLPQITRLVRQYRETGQVRARIYRRRKFVRVYTEADVRLLAKVDRAHERLSGPATRRILEREVEEYGHQEYARLTQISVGHLYNLRKRPDYRKQVALYEATRPAKISIAERRRPDPQGRPGYLRVDTVHQGDWDGHKGVYHINSVDAVTQWEVVGCVPIISAESLELLLEVLMAQHPVPIRGFHVDNGSEYINHVVAKLLGDSLVEFTKSRAYQSSDNALVEGKNGAIIRKHMGYGHIPAEHATRIQEFYVRYLNPYLNYHRPCGFATVTVDAKGKRRRKYPLADYATPYEKLKSLKEGGAVLRPGLSWEALEQIAKSASDTEFAERMRRAKIELLRQCKMESPVPPPWEVGK